MANIESKFGIFKYALENLVMNCPKGSKSS